MAAADVPGTGTALAGVGGVETNGISDNALGREVLLTGVLLGSSGGERRRVTSSATRDTNCSNTPAGGERGCCSTEAALEGSGDWVELTGVGCKAARLDFLRGGWPPAAIATALAEGLRTRLERSGGILSLQKNSEKHTRYCQNKIVTMKMKRLTEPVVGKNKQTK